MKKVKGAWKNAWNNVTSVDEVYGNYRVRNIMQYFYHLLSNIERKKNFNFRFFKSLGFKEVWGLEYDEGNMKKT